MNLQYAFYELFDEGSDFRSASWGMSKEEVKRSEDLLPQSEGDCYVTYRERVMGLDSVVGYHFLEGALVEAGYAFREHLGGGRVYISQYSRVKGVLTGSYGRPSFDEGAYGEGGGFCVLCLAEGECRDACPLVYLSEWTTGRSVIRLVLMGEGRGYDFGLLHRSREHELRLGRRER